MIANATQVQSTLDKAKASMDKINNASIAQEVLPELLKQLTPEAVMEVALPSLENGLASIVANKLNTTTFAAVVAGLMAFKQQDLITMAQNIRFQQSELTTIAALIRLNDTDLAKVTAGIYHPQRRTGYDSKRKCCNQLRATCERSCCSWYRDQYQHSFT